MVHGVFRSITLLSAIADRPARVWRDVVVVAGFSIAVFVELAIRDDLAWRPGEALFAFVLGGAVWVRRSFPLGATVAGFGGAAAVTVLSMFVGGDGEVGLYSAVVILLVPYALCRWASGRDVAIGVGIVVATWLVGTVVRYPGVGDAVGGLIVVAIPAIVGLEVRQFVGSRARDVEQARSNEREQIARELHDSVAHHVSAIVIQAQAGRVVAHQRPDIALQALETIEEAGARTLGEMRDMVYALRSVDDPERAPQRGIADIERLVTEYEALVAIELEISGDLTDLSPTIDAAVFRIAQESITNSVRHAKALSRVDLSLVASVDAVDVVVRDDGGRRSEPVQEGFGLIGMRERVALLGGGFSAGFDGRGGWVVRARLPRSQRRT